MVPSFSHVTRRAEVAKVVAACSLHQCRHASLTSAIARGIRQGTGHAQKLGGSRRRTAQDGMLSVKQLPLSKPRSRVDLERFERGPSKSVLRLRQRRISRQRIDLDAPSAKPYSTAGSEFLYGTFAVKAALQANRRQFYALYVWAGEETIADGNEVEHICQLATSKGVPWKKVGGSWEDMLLKLTNQRPHNGFVLEASQMPRLPVTSLERLEKDETELKLETGSQSQEDMAVNRIFRVYDHAAILPRANPHKRYPLLLWLDRITDTGNFGAIMRTAVFFGVDAIIVPQHGTAPFSPVTVKASAGAAEFVSVLTIQNETDFVKRSQSNGWKFFAATALDSTSTRRKTAKYHTSEHLALAQSPVVLMLGNEGEGLRPFLQDMADAHVTISQQGSSKTGVDSLNVSVAAGLLIARFLSPSAESLPVLG